MNPYQQSYGPPGYGMPPSNNYNYYGPGYQGYQGTPTQPPGAPYPMQGGAPGYPPQMPQDSSYASYPSGGYYGAALPYGTTPYPTYPQATYGGAPYNPYGQPSTTYGTYPGQYDQGAYSTASTIGDVGSYSAPTMSYGYPSAPPDPSSSNTPAPESGSGYAMPPPATCGPFPTTSGSFYSGSQFSTTVTDSVPKQKPDRPPPPTLPYAKASTNEKSEGHDEASTDSHPRHDSQKNWRSSSPSLLPTPKPRSRGPSPTREMGDKISAEYHSDDPSASRRHQLNRQTTADEWNEIADKIEADKIGGVRKKNHMDPKELSGVSSDDPAARADYKQKLNALAGLMTDVNLDDVAK